MANQHSTFLNDFEQIHREISVLFFLFCENLLLVLYAYFFFFLIISSAEQNINFLLKGKHLSFLSLLLVCIEITALADDKRSPGCSTDIMGLKFSEQTQAAVAGENWKRTYNGIHSICKSTVFTLQKSRSFLYSHGPGEEKRQEGFYYQILFSVIRQVHKETFKH